MSALDGAGTLSGLPEALLDRVPVDTAVLEVELVDEVVDLRDGPARDEPERLGLAAAAVLLARVDLGEPLVRSGDRAGMLHRGAGALAAEDLPDARRGHAASASTVRATQSTSSRESRRNARRS